LTPSPILVVLFALAAPGDSAATPAAPRDSSAALTAPRDTTSVRVVRVFDEFVVRAGLDDLGSAQTVRAIPSSALRTWPIDRLEDAVALQPGVVSQGGELHVRGGRTGELELDVVGVPLSEPLRDRAFELPLGAVARADLVTGGLEADRGGSLAGVLSVHTVDPPERATAAISWQTDANGALHYDRLSVSGGVPLGVATWGVVASADVALEDGSNPAARTDARSSILGGAFAWRAENRVRAHLKIASVERSGGVALEVVAQRDVDRPYDHAWSLDGYTTLCADPESCLTGPGFSPTPAPGYEAYRAADHVAVTDDRKLAAILSWSKPAAHDRWSAAFAWIGARTTTALDGWDDASYVTPDRLPLFGLSDSPTSDPYHVYRGDWPLYRSSGADRWFARADYALEPERRKARYVAGIGAHYDAVHLSELDGTQFGRGLDSLRSYRAWAPGGYAYVMGRWTQEGMIAHFGLRAELFTAGPQAEDQRFPSSGHAFVSISPRAGVAFPVGDRDAVSLSYVRIQQNPARDFLYDNRARISARQPLGNPALEPATVISYQAALKHLFGTRWYAQGAIFYRDLYGQVGTRNFSAPGAERVRRYTSEDNGHASGFELSALREGGESSRLEVHYTYMIARGTESLEDGDPYGVSRGERAQPIEATPLNWDRRHTITLVAMRQLPGHWSVAWATQAGSGLPWTPRERRQVDPSLANVNSMRFPWSELTDVSASWNPPLLDRRLTVGLELRNLFDERIDAASSVDGYPNPEINTVYDDYGAYRTETGNGGGAYWNDLDGDGLPGWIPVGDPRLLLPGRSVRLRFAARW
jgi:outer membrane receptor protein involved in Fe transport